MATTLRVRRDRGRQTSAAAEVAQTAVSALQDELAGLKPSQIERRARSAGVEEAELELAKDSGDAKAAMIELIVAAAPVGGARQEALRAEMATLKPSQLEQRARSLGVEELELKQAKDSDDPKASMVELIVAATSIGVSPEESLREELEALRPSQLEIRARDAGIGDEQLGGRGGADLRPIAAGG